MYTYDCPCCNQALLRHVGGGEVYWFCLHCYQEVPALSTHLRTKKLSLLDRVKVRLILAPRISPLYTWWKVPSLLEHRDKEQACFNFLLPKH